MKILLRKIPSGLRSKKTIYVCVVIASVFVLANVATAILYSSKTYPNTFVAGKSISNVSHDKLSDTVESIGLLPESVILKYRDKATNVQTTDLGIYLNIEETSQTIMKAHSWLPVWNLFSHKDVSFSSTTDDEKLHKLIEDYSEKQKVAPVDAKISLKDGKFNIIAEKSGHELELDSAKLAITNHITNGMTEVILEPRTTYAKITKEELTPKLEQIQKQQATSITLVFGNKTKSFSAAEIAMMFDTEGQNIELADANIQAAVTRTGQDFGILVQNATNAVAAIKQTLAEAKALTFTLVEAPKPTIHYTYCVSARGVPTSHLTGLSTKLASVFADARGWGLKKQVTFSKVSSGCNFTVWLSAASQMPTFGAICEPAWSCRVGANVVINFDRWQGATTAWNTAGGSLDNYRNMVINHEVGHWFGYYHSHCSGAGQLAPVMQQQSINLQGCKFNPWPTTTELASHRLSLGL